MKYHDDVELFFLAVVIIVGMLCLCMMPGTAHPASILDSIAKISEDTYLLVDSLRIIRPRQDDWVEYEIYFPAGTQLKIGENYEESTEGDGQLQGGSERSD